MKIKILMFGEEDICAQVQRLLMQDDEFSFAGSVSDESRILDEIDRTSADLVLVTDTSAVSLRVCHQVYLLRPRSVAVVLSDAREGADLNRIIVTGVHYILPDDLDAVSMSSELKSVFHNESNRILAMENTGMAANKSRVIAVFGAKGGLGKTTLAVNLAIALAQKKNKVVLLDYDLQFGDVAAYLGQDPKNSVLELVQEQGNPNADVIRQFLSMHSSGVSFLPAPHSPEHADSISTMQADRIVAALRIYYDYVIIDCPEGFDDLSAACLDCSSLILFVAGRDIPAIRNAKKSLSVLLALVHSEKVKLVAGKNSDTAAKAVKDADILRVLGQPVWKSVPYDEKAAILAANQGEPVILGDRRSRLARAVIDIADEIDQAKGTAEKPKKRTLGKRRDN